MPKTDALTKQVIITELKNRLNNKLPAPQRVTKQQIEAVIDAYNNAIIEYMCLGLRVASPLGVYEAQLRNPRKSYSGLKGALKVTDTPARFYPKIKWGTALKETLKAMTPYLLEKLPEEKLLEISRKLIELQGYQD